MPSRSVAIEALALVLAAALAPQSARGASPPAPPAAFSEKIDVDVVSVDVFVTDRSGRPVAGLGRDDFELRVDGKRVPITNFYASSGDVDGSGAAAQRGEAPVPEAERLNLIVFLHGPGLTPTERNVGLAALAPFFRRSLGRYDRVILASYDLYGIRVRRPPAGDVEAVLAALGDLSRPNSRGGMIAAEEYMAGRTGDVEWREFLQEQREFDTRKLLQRELADFVASIAGLPGRKALLFLAGNLRMAADDPLARRLAERANAERVTLYGLGSGLALRQLATLTGGQTMVLSDNLFSLLDRIHGDLSTYYSLGFTPEHGRAEEGRSHSLAVSLPGRRDLEVRAPQSYAPRGRDERFAGRVAAATVAGEGDNPLGLRLRVERDERAGGGKRALTVLVAFPLAGITLEPEPGKPAGQPSGQQSGHQSGRLTLVLAARDAAGRGLPVKRLALPLHIADDRLAAARQGNAGYRLRLEVPAGESTIAVGLRDELGGVDSIAAATYVAGGKPAH